MRPERITISAFGPYPKEEFLDFSELQGHSLFLICGPTGAGKSTILDAICYALYGRTSGAVRSGESMRSNYVGLEAETYVTFDFAVGEAHYRVHRCPTQWLERKKGDKDKPVEKKAKAELYEIDEAGEEIRLITARGVSLEVEKILGVGVDQFRQIILLPQGDFRKLLLSDSSERQTIMAQLFQTERYRLFEERLKKEALRLRGEYEEGKRNRAIYLETCGAETEEALAEQVKVHEMAVSEARTRLSKAEKEEIIFARHYDDSRALFDAYQRKAKAESALFHLAEEKEKMEALRQRAEKVKKAREATDIWVETESIYHRRRALEKEREEAKGQIPALEKQKKDLDQARKDIIAEEGVYKDRLEQRTALLTYEKQSATYEKAVTALEQAEKDYTSAEKEMARLTDVWNEAKEKTLSAKKHWMGQNSLFLHGQAYVLAEKLEEGRPCPVCGSKVHPKPAESGDMVVTEKDVEEAEGIWKEAEKKEKEFMKQKETFHERNWLPAKERRETEKATKDTLEEALPERYRKREVIRTELTTLEKAISTYENRRRDIEEAQKKADLAYHGAVKKEELLEAQYQEIYEASEKKKIELDERVKSLGFATMKECGAYREDIPHLDEWERALKTYDENCHAEEEIKKAEEAKIEGRPVPDMERLTKEREDVIQHIKDLTTEKAHQEAVVKKEKEVMDKLARLSKTQSGLEKKYELAGHLAELAGGKDTGVNLERFVLGALLDAVTTKANLRLGEMSSHRYSLLRKRGERDDARKTAGLDLEVYDENTGRSRPASTLSGGETFMASLSLALGLADVVQEYAGGVHLDAMFIDEGFGSLDSESLDLAMKTLQKLKGSHRLVGLISHVGGLEERISAKLRVTKTQSGSTAAFEVG